MDNARPEWNTEMGIRFAVTATVDLWPGMAPHWHRPLPPQKTSALPDIPV